MCRPGGEVIIVNHFSADEGKPGWEGMRGWVERRMAPFADKLGWRPVFDIERVLVCEDLTLMEKRGLRPWGLFTMMRFRKAKEGPRPPPEAGLSLPDCAGERAGTPGSTQCRTAGPARPPLIHGPRPFALTALHPASYIALAADLVATQPMAE